MPGSVSKSSQGSPRKLLTLLYGGRSFIFFQLVISGVFQHTLDQRQSDKPVIGWKKSDGISFLYMKVMDVIKGSGTKQNVSLVTSSHLS